MKKLWVVLIFGLFSSVLHADYVHEYTVDLYYANGVLASEEDDALESWTNKADDLKSKYPSLRQALKFGEAKLSYNTSYLWGVGDFAETIIQYRREKLSKTGF